MRRRSRSRPRRVACGGGVTAARDGRRRSLGSYPRVHCWLLPPLQVHSSTRAPLAVEAPVTSRQSPDCTPVTVPFGLRFHCWLAPPLQVQVSTFVPAVVWLL